MANPQSQQKPQDQSSQQQNAPGKDSGTDFGQRGQAGTNPTDTDQNRRSDSGRPQDQQQGSKGPGSQSGVGRKEQGQTGKSGTGTNDMDADESDSENTAGSGGYKSGQDSAAKGRDGGKGQNDRSREEQGGQKKPGADKNACGS